MSKTDADSQIPNLKGAFSVFGGESGRQCICEYRSSEFGGGWESRRSSPVGAVMLAHY